MLAILLQELRNLKSNQNIRAQNLVRLVLFYPLKYDQMTILLHRLYG